MVFLEKVKTNWDGFQTGSNQLEKYKIFGVQVDHLIAGIFLFVVAGTILYNSIYLVPQLQSSVPDAEAQLYPEALAIFQDREVLLQERVRLLEMADKVDQLVADQREAGDLRAQVEAAADDLAENADALEEAAERYKQFAENSAASTRLLTKLFTSDHDMLVLLLAVLMGALGGVISVAKAFVTDDVSSPHPSDYFIRPIFGAVMAFVVFLLFKAGQPLIGISVTDDALNPFPIAILGVVSGLMAKEAINLLEGWGSGIFSGKTKPSSLALTGFSVSPPGVTDAQSALEASSHELNQINQAEALLREVKDSIDPNRQPTVAEPLRKAATAGEQARKAAAEIVQEAEIAAAATRRAATANEANRTAILQEVDRANDAAIAALKRLREHTAEIERHADDLLGHVAKG